MQRRSLELLASSRNGVNEELFVLGPWLQLPASSGAGFAATQREVIKAGAKAIEVCHIHGRRPEAQAAHLVDN